MMLSDVCLSVAYIGPKSRTERLRKTKIGNDTEVAHVTRDSDTTFKVRRSKVKVTRPLCSPPCWRVRRLQRWARERVGHGKLLLRCRLLDDRRRFGAHGGRRGAGACIPPAYSLFKENSKATCVALKRGNTSSLLGLGGHSFGEKLLFVDDADDLAYPFFL